MAKVSPTVGTVLDAAREYLRHGYAVVPVLHCEKGPAQP